VTINQGEAIVGQLSCAPNARNNRDLDITIAYKRESDDEPETTFSYKMCVVPPSGRFISASLCTLLHVPSPTVGATT
jgi:hypothetical protein